jgi:hypothetical protein
MVRPIGLNHQPLIIGFFVCLLLVVVRAPNITYDFIEYWAAGALNLAGENPYDPELIHAVELANSFEADEPLLMYNPPPMLTIGMLLGAAPYRTAAAAWLCVLGISLVSSITILWKLAGGSRRHVGTLIVVSIWFAPTLFALFFGQVSVVILLGLALFLKFERSENYFCAGATTFTLLIKPHLVYLIAIAVAAWGLQRRSTPFFLGIAFAASLAAVPALFNPNVYVDYAGILEWGTIGQYSTSTAGSAARLMADQQGRFGMQFLPAVVGLSYLIVRLIKAPLSSWDWQRELPGLVVVSLATSAYGWVYDQVLLLVVLVPFLASVVGRTGRAAWLDIVIGAIVIGLPLLQGLAGVNALWYFWIPWAFLPITLIVHFSSSDGPKAGSVAVK